jgi:hypothetical protein
MAAREAEKHERADLALHRLGVSRRPPLTVECLDEERAIGSGSQ